jgi:hypothetical protein
MMEAGGEKHRPPGVSAFFVSDDTSAFSTALQSSFIKKRLLCGLSSLKMCSDFASIALSRLHDSCGERVRDRAQHRD